MIMAKNGEIAVIETALAKHDAMHRAMLDAYSALQEADSIYEARNLRHTLELFHARAKSTRRDDRAQAVTIRMLLCHC